MEAYWYTRCDGQVALLPGLSPQLMSNRHNYNASSMKSCFGFSFTSSLSLSRVLPSSGNQSPDSEDVRNGTVLRMSDLTADSMESTEIVVEQEEGRGYEETVDALMSEVGALKAEVRH